MSIVWNVRHLVNRAVPDIKRVDAFADALRLVHSHVKVTTVKIASVGIVDAIIVVFKEE